MTALCGVSEIHVTIWHVGSGVRPERQGAARSQRFWQRGNTAMASNGVRDERRYPVHDTTLELSLQEWFMRANLPRFGMLSLVKP